jgi:hypothetical protein
MELLKLEFGELKIYKNYIVGVMNEGTHISIDIVAKITDVANERFNNKPWAYISNRVNSYSLDVTVHIEAPKFEENMLAFAAVTYRKVTSMTTNIEKGVHSPSYKRFFKQAKSK